tara:strand:+ start:946 stop:3306 length:2361 start_codon:yes stop_codon:yes gene_type:complete
MSFYDDASLILLANGEAGKGTDDNGKVYTLKPAEELSSTDLVINGDFSIDGPGANGELGTAFGSYGWNTIATNEAQNQQEGTSTIANGILTLTNGAGDVDARAYLTDGVSTRHVVTTNTYYRVTYTVVENTNCTNFRVYHQNGQFVTAPGSVGTHTLIIRNTNNQLFLFTNSTESSSISIDQVSLREITTQSKDFTMDRGTDLSATVIGKDGLVKKTRENLLINTVFAGLTTDDRPTGYNTSTTIGAGTLGPLDSDSTKVKIEITNVSGGRYFLNGTASITDTALCTSVFVDAVTGTAPEVRQVVRAFPTGEGTRTVVHFALKDGEVVDETDAVEAGHRYAFVASYSTSSVHRFGIGTNQTVTDLGTVTLSRPQIERGVKPTDYIKNSSTTATAVVGMKIDDPRFNYDIGGTTPHLLLEPQRVNLIHYSDYMEDYTFSNCYSTVSHNHGISPEGINNSTLFSATAETADVGHRLFGSNNFTAEVGETYTVSVFAKKGTKRYFAMTLRQSNQAVHGHDSVIFDLEDGSVSGANPATGSSQDYGNGWYRCIITVAMTNTSDILARPYLFIAKSSSVVSYANSTTSDNIELYGLQIEDGSEATSYIPSYGSATTRTADGLGNLTLPSAITDEDDYTFFVDETASLKMIGNRGPRLTHSDSAKDSNMGYYINSSNKKTFFCWSNGGSSDKPFSDVTSDSVDTKYAFHVDNTNERVRCYVDGECIADVAITTDINADKITHSTGEGSLQKLNSILYFPQALSDVDCKVLTGRTNYTAFPEMADKLGYRTYE